MKTSDRYLKLVQWSEEDQCYVGTCPGVMLGGVHGDDEAKVYRSLCRAVDDWLRILAEDGDPLPPATAGKTYSGKFVLRVGRDLHQQLGVAALSAGTSLNAYCTQALVKHGRPAAARRAGARRSRAS